MMEEDFYAYEQRAEAPPRLRPRPQPGQCADAGPSLLTCLRKLYRIES